MALDRQNFPRTAAAATVAELIARRDYVRAIERLKAKLSQRPLDPHTQLQLADTLILAGRGTEALTVLLQLAEVFAADGFFAKAVAILKRVDKIEPGRPDVRAKLAAFVEKQRGPRTETFAALPPPAPQAAELPRRAEGETTTIEFGMEELGTETIRRLRAPKLIEPVEPVDEAPPPPPMPEPGPEPAPAAMAPLEIAPMPAPDPLPELSAPPLPLPVPSAPPPELAAPLEATASAEAAVEARESFGARLRGVLRRYLAPSPLMPTPPPPAAEAGAAPSESPSSAADAAPAPTPTPADDVAPSAHLLGLVAQILPYAGEPVDVDADAISVEPEPEPVVEVVPEGAAPELPPMTTAEFQEKVLDLVQMVVQQTPQPLGSDEPIEVFPIPEPPALFETAALFAELTRDEVFALVTELGLMHFDPGDVIVTEGEPGGSLFLIGGGRAKVFVRSPEGRSFAVGELREGDFFGEISALSGRPRSATITAATECDLLQLDPARLDALAAERPRVREVLEDFYVRRAGSPAAAAVRILQIVDDRTEQRAIETLESYFGESRWDPKMRLRLADALARAGNKDDAVAILLVLADDLAREGYPERAVAIVKKIESLHQHEVELPLAPLDEERVHPILKPDRGLGTQDGLSRWVVDLAREAAQSKTAAPAPVAAPSGSGLRGSPLFQGLGDDELFALVKGLNLRTAEPGDLLVTEGEPGDSVFVLACGAAKVFGRTGEGVNVARGTLPEGSFFGEIAALAGGRRTATVVASAPCEMLELTREALETMTAAHPRLRAVLERHYTERTAR